MKTSLFSFDSLAKKLLAAVLVIVGISILPLADALIVNSKLFSFFLMTALIVISYGASILQGKVIQIRLTPFLLPLTFFLVASLASIFFATELPYEALLGMGGAYIAFTLLPLIAGALSKSDESEHFTLGLSILALITLVSFVLELLGFGPAKLIEFMFGVPVASTQMINLVGSPLIAFQVLVVALVTTGLQFLHTTKRKALYGAIAGASSLGIIALIWVMLPGKVNTPVLPPLGATWSVAVQALSTPRSALIGFGPESYQEAYTIFKPSWINATPYWNNNFILANNLPLTIIPTMGLLGLLGWIWLGSVTLKHFKSVSKNRRPVAAGVVTTFALQLLFPPSVMIMVIQAVGLAFLIMSSQKKYSILELHALVIDIFKKDSGTKSNYSRPFIYLVSGAIFLASGLSIYGMVRGYAGHYFLFQSNKARFNNDLVLAYNLQRSGVAANPYLPFLRRNYAITNIQLATALSNKADITDGEREQVSQLIQQAIREGRAATLLNGDNYLNWLALGDIYSNLIGIAEGSENWAVSAYTQAINVNRTNPLPRLTLGGTLYNLGQYQQALSIFQQAAQLKPDLPNAYYNQANAYRKLGNYEASAAAYQAALERLQAQGIKADDPNYLRAMDEMADLEAFVATQSANPSGAAVQPGQPNSNQSILDANLADPESLLNPDDGLELSPVDPASIDATGSAITE